MAEEQNKQKAGQKQPQQAQQRQQKQASINIVRIAGKDINASLKVTRAIDEVKGIGHNLAFALAMVAKEKYAIDPDASIGSLSEDQLHNLESIFKDPVSFGIPAFMVNRSKDPETGLNLHVIGTDLIVKHRLQARKRNREQPRSKSE